MRSEWPLPSNAAQECPMLVASSTLTLLPFFSRSKIMYRMFGAMIVGLLSVAVARAHFTYIVAEADGTKARVIFSDDLNLDTNVNIEKIGNTKLTLRNAAGKESALEWKKGEGFYQVDLPGHGMRVVYGTTDYGVLQKGDAKAFRLIYFPKAIVGGFRADALGDKVKLEILASGEPGNVRFQVVSNSKPISEAEVSVLLPSSAKKAVKTDKEGYTPNFDALGRYGLNARMTESVGGDHGGKKFEESRYYATLVVDVVGK